jgi:hypothetical protein
MVTATAPNSSSSHLTAALVLGGYIEVIVEELDMQRVEHIGLALEAYDGAYQFEEEEDGGSDGANQLVFRTPTGVLDIALPPSVPVAWAVTAANSTSTATEQMWSEALRYLRERLAAAIWEANGGYCPVIINIYEQTYTTLAEGVVTLNSYVLSAVVDLSQTTLGLAVAAAVANKRSNTSFDFEATAQTIRDILLETTTTIALQPLYPGSLPASSAGEDNHEDEDDDTTAATDTDGIKIRKLREADAHRTHTGSANVTLEIYAPLHIPGIHRDGDALHCLDFDRRFYPRLVERFGENVFLSTTWENPARHSIIDGEYPEDFDHEDDQYEDED